MRVPIRNAVAGSADAATVEIHPVPSQQTLILKIAPPKAPSTSLDHVPCDIVLVIDVSASMSADAPVPGEGQGESTGLSVLDLTKHAALTIIETLNDSDRLGIVTFSTNSTVVQPLLPMSGANKDTARSNVKSLYVQSSTNLWHGIRDGIRVFNEAESKGNVPAMMVLTDGMPNHMCPQQGYIPKLKSMPALPASIHTFGFGYGLRSGLLKSLAEYGNGNYAFIPDAGMLATVFVHAVANLQCTYATNATLSLSYPSSLKLDEVSEQSVVKEDPVTETGSGKSTLKISLGNLQFGQSRDIFLRVTSASEDATVSAQLEYTPSLTSKSQVATVSADRAISEPSNLSEADVAYIGSRALLTQSISAMFPLGPDLEHRGESQTETDLQRMVAKLISNIPAKDYADEANQSLMLDINGPEPQGQVSIATSKADYWRRWGVHYLPSYCGAHARQICNSFKDPGPLRYGVDSPLFIACRDRLSEAFDNLPAPEPSLTSPPPYTAGRFAQRSARARGPISMSVYQQASGVCFAGSTTVELASGRTVPIRRLRRGIKVRTPTGTRKVAMVLRTAVTDEPLCRVGADLLVTPWHPICLDGSKTWTFPALVATSAVRYTGSVYSVLLQRDHNAQSHAIRLAGSTWGVTLGHGLTTGRDARAHHFFGDYNRVGKSLVHMGVDKFGVVEGRGVARDAASGLVCGFLPARATTLREAPLVPSRTDVARMAHTGGYSP